MSDARESAWPNEFKVSGIDLIDGTMVYVTIAGTPGFDREHLKGRGTNLRAAVIHATAMYVSKMHRPGDIQSFDAMVDEAEVEAREFLVDRAALLSEVEA